MLSARLLFFVAALATLLHASTASILVTPFSNEGQAADLNWIGESVSETVMTELTADGLFVLDRDAREQGFRQLGLKPDSTYTKATLVKLGQTIDTSMICYGSYQIALPTPDAQPRDGTIRISARFLDLRKLRDASEFSETGKLMDLSRLEEHLAWQCLRFLDPETKVTAEQLLIPSKLIRLDAKESYIRGLLAPTLEQKQKWLEQAVRLDTGYAQPEFELGRLAWNRRDYRQAAAWFSRIPKNDPLYLEARFKRGLSAYMVSDYLTAKACFHDLSQDAPLNEVFNNLGAAESRLNEPAALDNFRRACDGDNTDTTYNFNYALALYRQGRYDEAAQHLHLVIDRAGSDAETASLLSRCEQRIPNSTGVHGPAERIKDNFDLATFRQLKAMVQTSR